METIEQQLKTALEELILSIECPDTDSDAVVAKVLDAHKVLAMYDAAVIPTDIISEAHRAIDNMRTQRYPSIGMERMFVAVTEDKHPNAAWWESDGAIVHEQYLRHRGAMEVYDTVKGRQSRGQKAQAFMLVPIDIVKYMESS